MSNIRQSSSNRWKVPVIASLVSAGGVAVLAVAAVVVKKVFFAPKAVVAQVVGTAF